MNESSRSSSEMINRLFSQFGIPFVKDRTGCSLAACGTAVCQQALSRRRLSSRRVMERATAGRSRVDRKRRFRLEGASAGSSEVACVVCEDEASGWHYGAVTCDSCKSFFERSVKDRHIYDCHFNRDCDLRLQRRNHCQGCRWDRCLDAGMIVSAVCKTRALGNDIETDAHPHLRHRHWTRLEAEDMLRMADQSSNLAVTPRPSLPSPTDTENSQYDGFWEDEAGNWTALNDSQPRQESMPISFELVRDALIPLDAPETLAARLTDLERSCLATLFRWNKRRLEHRSDNSNGNFGAAAANWAPILLASATRQFLASCLILPTESGKLLTVALVDRLKWLLRGREFEFEPLLDQFENLAKQIGEMCNQLLSTIQEAKRDVIRDIILLMGEHTEDELRAGLQQADSSHQQQQQQQHRQHLSAMLQEVLSRLDAGAEQLASARPEHRALLLASLVAEPDSTASSAATVAAPTEVAAAAAGCHQEDEDDAVRVPVLFGL